MTIPLTLGVLAEGASEDALCRSLELAALFGDVIVAAPFDAVQAELCHGLAHRHIFLDPAHPEHAHQAVVRMGMFSWALVLPAGERPSAAFLAGVMSAVILAEGAGAGQLRVWMGDRHVARLFHKERLEPILDLSKDLLYTEQLVEVEVVA